MRTTAFRLEFYKSRRRGLLLTVLLIVGFEALWIYYAWRDPSLNEIEIGWMDLLYQLPSLNSIMFPILAAILASRLADLEHKGSTWKLLETIEPPKRLFFAKFLCGAVYLLLALVLLVGAMLLCGHVLNFAGTPPIQKFVLFFLFQLVAVLEIFAVQLLLSTQIRNQMIPLCLGCGGSFIGLMLLFVPVKPLQLLLPWGHTSLLFLVSMTDWDPDTRILQLAYTTVPWAGFALTLVCLLVWVWLGRRLLDRKEV